MRVGSGFRHTLGESKSDKSASRQVAADRRVVPDPFLRYRLPGLRDHRVSYRHVLRTLRIPGGVPLSGFRYASALRLCTLRSSIGTLEQYHSGGPRRWRSGISLANRFAADVNSGARVHRASSLVRYSRLSQRVGAAGLKTSGQCFINDCRASTDAPDNEMTPVFKSRAALAKVRTRATPFCPADHR